MKKLNVYHVAGDESYSNWIIGAKSVRDLESADLVLFEGGSDVHPMVYGEPVGSYTHFDAQRDAREVPIFKKAVELQKPILGICRGSQFTCAMSGGRLVQHQEQQPYIHGIIIGDGADNIKITSTHHQAQFPHDMPKDEYKILAYTRDLSMYHLNGKNDEMFPPKEVEICYYPKTHALAIQGHPEYLWKDRQSYSLTFDYLHILIDNFLNKKL